MRESGGVLVILGGLVLLIMGLNGTLGNTWAAITGKADASGSGSNGSGTTPTGTPTSDAGGVAGNTTTGPGLGPSTRPRLIQSLVNTPGSGVSIG